MCYKCCFDEEMRRKGCVAVRSGTRLWAKCSWLPREFDQGVSILQKLSPQPRHFMDWFSSLCLPHHLEACRSVLSFARHPGTWRFRFVTTGKGLSDKSFYIRSQTHWIKSHFEGSTTTVRPSDNEHEPNSLGPLTHCILT